MSRTVYEGNTKVHFAPTIANINAPTMVELAAGTDFTPFTTKDGVNTPSTQNMVDSASINETFDAQRVGSWGGPVTLTMFRDDTDESDGWDAITRGLEGFLVIGRFSPDGIGTGDKVEVYPVEAHQPVTLPSAGNEMQRFTAQFAVTSQPDLDATVVAS